MPNCNIGKRDYSWGAAVTPKHPRGWYRELYFLQESAGLSAEYPASWGECYPPIPKRDYVDPAEFWNNWVLGAGLVHPIPRLQDESRIWDSLRDLYLHVHGQPVIDHHYYNLIYAMVWDSYYTQRWHAIKMSVNTSNLAQDLASPTIYPWDHLPFIDYPVWVPAIVLSTEWYPDPHCDPFGAWTPGGPPCVIP